MKTPKKTPVKSTPKSQVKKEKPDSSKKNTPRKSIGDNKQVKDTPIKSKDQVLEKVYKAKNELQNQSDLTSSLVLSQLEGIKEVEELPSEEVVTKIEDLVISVVNQIFNEKSFEFLIPNRGSSNQKYLEEIDRIVLGDKISKRLFLNTAHVRKTAITTRVVQLIHEVLLKKIHITKRDLFCKNYILLYYYIILYYIMLCYIMLLDTDVKLFKDQTESDAVLDDVACMVGCTRTSLHVVASDKGLVVGRIQYYEAGDYIDCTKMGVGGKAIPPYIDQITDIRSDAEFIILVEKEAAYMRLAEDRFYNKYPCIVITGKGQPDVATRLFLRKVRDQLKIPILALVDSDPYGLKILSVYCSGSKSMSYDSSHLTTSDIKWLGVRPSDLNKYKLPAQCRLPMTEHDKKMGEELLKEPFIQKNQQWVNELQLMLKSGEKAEIQALSSFGFQFITEEFLPRKLMQGDWI